MDSYQKGRNVEPVESRETLPFEGLPHDFIWMRVKAGSKLRNVAGAAERALTAAAATEEAAAVVFSGHGQAVGKVVSCAEIIRRRRERFFKFTIQHLLIDIKSLFITCY